MTQPVSGPFPFYKNGKHLGWTWRTGPCPIFNIAPPPPPPGCAMGEPTNCVQITGSSVSEFNTTVPPRVPTATGFENCDVVDAGGSDLGTEVQICAWYWEASVLGEPIYVTLAHNGSGGYVRPHAGMSSANHPVIPPGHFHAYIRTIGGDWAADVGDGTSGIVQGAANFSGHFQFTAEHNQHPTGGDGSATGNPRIDFVVCP